MIPQITEYFGDAASYATLSNATVQLAEMGDRVISTQVKIDGDIVPNFDGWELSFRGERFVLDVKDPQAAKDNTSVNSIINLTFYSWATLQLKRYFVFTTPPTATGVITVDKYDAPVILTLANFGTFLNNVLSYYFHGKIVASVYIDPSDPNNEPASWDLNYTKIWDVLQKIYEIYGVRWRIEYDESTDTYIIKINYPAPAILDHEFQYGFDGGLMRFERQVQSGDITNILLGRGGTRNVPYRYFKRVDPQNPEWAPDPDAIPEIANLYIDRIRDINFRNYIQGWKTNPRRDTTSWPDTVVETYDEERGATDWAYAKGHTDTTFDPVEYVKDDESILKYGEHWGHLDDDDDIYPTIQGAEIAGGRADVVVAVSPITTDDIRATTFAASNIVDLSNGVVNQTDDIYPTTSDLDLPYKEIRGDKFTVPTGTMASLEYNDFFISADASLTELAKLTVVTERSHVSVFRVSDGQEVLPSHLGAGTYYYVIYLAIRNINDSVIRNATYGVNGLRLVQTAAGSGDEWKPTFDIWIRNIFESGQSASETTDEYALRVWGPILGDHLGDEAAVAFSDGQMSISEDYTFKIAAYPVLDRSKTLNGMQSEWRITLYKTDAEFDATGLYVPNATTGGRPIAGDHFYFLGIDMPHFYVVKAEERVRDNKVLALYGKSDITPTWVVGLDKVRLDQEYNEDQERLFDKIEAGVQMKVYDRRFTGGRQLTLYANSVTFTWSDETVILPQVDVVLADKIAVTKSQISEMQGDISNLRSSIAQMSGVENVVREQLRPLFLGKTGEEETSLSPTKFASLLTSEDFKQGGFGGKGWGFYRDNSMAFQNIEEVAAPTRRAATRSGEQEAGEDEQQAVPSVRAGSQSVLEIDRLIVRREMQVNNLVVNQIAYVGGKQIISAAAMECTQVIENNDSYDCFFDQKQGSIKNLFQEGDIAMGQVFTAENVQLRFYKMIVTKVGLDYIRLGKSPKNGSGIPEKGDVIVQYGSISNRDRRYAIVRDVIGGGYERMLSDLDTIYSDGVEYYFAGLNASINPNGERQDLADSADNTLVDSAENVLTVLAGAKPRFFVGDADSNIEFNAADRIMRLKGNIVQSPSGAEFPVPCFRGEYDDNEWYYYGDLVTYTDGSSWIHIGRERTKGTAPSTGNVWRLYTESGKSTYRLDLTNEIAAINADKNGNILSGATRPTCTATLYYGVAPVSGATYSLTIPQGQNVQGVSINSSTGVLTFNPGSHGTPFSFSGNSLLLTITATKIVDNQNISLSSGMTITKSMPGVDGQPASSYWLVMDSDKVSVDPNNNNAISPTTVAPTAMMQTGENAPVAIDLSTQTEFSITYNYDTEAEAAIPASGYVTIALMNGSVKRNTLHFHLYKTTDNVATEVDQEAVPILYDGKNGSSAVHLDIDNEVDMVQTDSTGNVMSARTITVHATMYNGATVATDASLVSTAASLAIGGVTPTLSISNGVVTASWAFTTSNTLSAAATVNIQVSFGGTTHTAQFTIAPSLGQAIYQLKPSMSAVPFQRDASGNLTPASQNVGLSIVKIDGPSTAEYSSASAAGVTVIYSFASMPSSATPDTTHLSWTSGNITVANTETNLYIAMFNSSGILLDRETIPVVKDGAKGGKGESGRIPRGPRAFDGNDTYQGYTDPYGAGGTDDIFYDTVYIDDPQHVGQILLFYCLQGSGANTHPPVSGGTTGYWAPANQFDFVATHVFLADSAKIKFLSGNDIYVTGVSGSSEVIYAGMLGGTGVNFFAGPDTTKSGIAAQAANAAFRVDNAGNLYAGSATIAGSIEASGNNFKDENDRWYAITSRNGMWISNGGIISYHTADASTSGSIAQQLIESHRGNKTANMNVSTGSAGGSTRMAVSSTDSGEGNAEIAVYTVNNGDVYMKAQKDSNNYAEINLLGTGTAKVSRKVSGAGGSSEHILSSPTMQRVVVCDHGAVPQPGDSGYDANTLYLEKAS